MDECDNLKQFIIPKRRTSASDVLLAIDQNSIEYKSDVLEVIQQSFRHKDSLACFAFHNPHIVQNPLLLTEFNEKRKLMKELCNDKELKCSYAFIHLDSRSEAEKICREGLHVGNTDMKSLGDPNLGAYACKYPDILPPWMSCRISVGHLVIFKFIKGKVKTMVENKTGDALEPTPGFDCHVARTSMQSDEFESSQVYVYEYDNNMDVLERPRQLLPFALVAFKFTPKKLDFSKFYKAKVIRKNVNLPPAWPQTFAKGNDTGPATQQQVNVSEVKIPEALATMSPNHTLEIHRARPYVLWSGSAMINNRIICTVNMYSDHFVACPFYLGADIKLNSEFQTDKLFSHFFLDKLDQLNKELTIWNNIYYTYVKLKSTENMTSKLVKVEKYLQDKDSSLLYSVEDSVKLLVIPNCRQAERLGLDDPDYVHAIFVSNRPNVYATKSGYQKTLKQIMEEVGKTFLPPILNKSDPRQMKKLLALRGSLNVLDGMNPIDVEEAVVPVDRSDVGRPATNDPRSARPADELGVPQCKVVAISPVINNDFQMEEVGMVFPDTENSSEKVVPDSEQISEIEQKLEQDIIKLKLSLKTLSMPFMKNNLEIIDDVPLNEDIEEAVEKDECELRTVVIHKEVKVSAPEKPEVVANGNIDNVADGLKALQDYNDDSFDVNAVDHYMDHEFVKEDRKDYDDDADAEDEAGGKRDDEDDDDDMDDDLADQIVLRCLQPSFMSPHVKLDSLGHLQSSENVQEIDRRINPNVHYGDFLGMERSFNASSNCFMKIKEELNIKSEPVEFPEACPRENAKLLKRQSEPSLESGEILTPELSGGGKDDFGDVGNSGTEHQETLVISDNETEESSVIIVEDLCVIPVRRTVDVTAASDDDADLPSIIYEYGDDGRLIYRNISVKLLNDYRCTEVREDELLSNRQDSGSALDEDMLCEILRKSFKRQYKRNIRRCQRTISISSNSEDEQECHKDDGATNKPGLTPRKVEIGYPMVDLKEQFPGGEYHPSHDKPVESSRSWEDFLLKFLSLSDDQDIEKDHTTAFRKYDARLSDIFQKNSMPRFFRPLYVYKSTLEEIQETFGSLASEIENERSDQEEPAFSSGDVQFFEERKKCVALMDEWISENNPMSDSSNEAGVCNLRWFQCLNKDCKSKVVLESMKKTHDDCVASHFFLSSMEDEVSISGIPFLEDVGEKSPSSYQVDERCTYPFPREDELMCWPKNLHTLDSMPKNYSIQRRVFKGATRILSLRICTAKDPRLAPTINSDSIYWSLTNRPHHSDMEFDIDTDTSLLPELENLIVTVCFNSSTPSNGCDNSQSKLDETTSVSHYDFTATLELSMFDKITKVNEQQDLRTHIVNQDYLSDTIYLGTKSISDILENGRIGNSQKEDFMAEKYVDNYEAKKYFPDILRNKAEFKETILEIEGNTTGNIYSIAFTSSETNGMQIAEAKTLVPWPSEMNEYSSTNLFQTKATNKRCFENEFEVCKKPRISKDADICIEEETSCRKSNLGHNDRYCNNQSKCNQCLKSMNAKKFKSSINYTYVCKSCKKFFIKKYLKCHRSISQHAAENKDSFLINAFLSMMCFRHLQRKCPNDSKKSSKFLAYFKNVPSERKMLTHRNYIHLDKTIRNVAKHVQRSNRFHHSMFLSALALNYHSQYSRIKFRDTSNQLKQENENINKVVQACLNDFDSEMDVLLSNLNCIYQVPMRETVCKEKTSLFNHFLNLSHYSKNIEPIVSLKREFCKILSSTEKILQTQEKARKPDEIPAANRKCENSWKQIKLNRHGCSSSETKINKSKSIKLTATGGKLIHSRSTSSYLPDFLKIRSRTVSAGSPMCRVSSSDEIVSNLSESSASNSCQDLFICSTSSEVQSEVFESKNNILTTMNNYQSKACAPTDIEVQQMVESQSGISSDKNAIFNKNTSNETNRQYSMLNICGPPIQNYQTMFQAQPLRPMLHYPWNNVVLTVHSPPPLLGVTYPLPQALPLCNNFISPIPPPMPMHGFYSIPPPFCFNVPPPITRPCVANVAPPSLDLKIINKSQHAQRQPTHPQSCDQGSFGTQSKRIYVFNKDRSLSHNIEKFLQFKGALIFDPYNIVMLRNIPNIQCFILVHFQDLDKLDEIPNILQLKKDLRVQFVAYKDVNDVKYQRFQMIFPKGGVLIFEEETFLALETGIFQSICKSLKRQMSENAKPWRLIFDRAIKGILEDLSSRAIEGQHYKGLLDSMKEFEEAGLIHISTGSEKSLKPQKMERYLEICLNLQSSHCSKFRHFLFLTEKVIRSEDSLKFTSRGVDILTISSFAKGFLSMSIKNPNVPTPVKQETKSHAKFTDAVLSSAAKPCVISF